MTIFWPLGVSLKRNPWIGAKTPLAFILTYATDKKINSDRYRTIFDIRYSFFFANGALRTKLFHRECQILFAPAKLGRFCKNCSICALFFRIGIYETKKNLKYFNFWPVFHVPPEKNVIFLDSLEHFFKKNFRTDVRLILSIFMKKVVPPLLKYSHRFSWFS